MAEQIWDSSCDRGSVWVALQYHVEGIKSHMQVDYTRGNILDRVLPIDAGDWHNNIDGARKLDQWVADCRNAKIYDRYRYAAKKEHLDHMFVKNEPEKWLWTDDYQSNIVTLSNHLFQIKDNLKDVVNMDTLRSWDHETNPVAGAQRLYEYANSHMPDAKFVAALKFGIKMARIEFVLKKPLNNTVVTPIVTPVVAPVESDAPDDICVVCQKDIVQVINLPCKHTVTCLACASDVCADRKCLKPVKRRVPIV